MSALRLSALRSVPNILLAYSLLTLCGCQSDSGGSVGGSTYSGPMWSGRFGSGNPSPQPPSMAMQPLYQPDPVLRRSPVPRLRKPIPIPASPALSPDRPNYPISPTPPPPAPPAEPEPPMTSASWLHTVAAPFREAIALFRSTAKTSMDETEEKPRSARADATPPQQTVASVSDLARLPEREVSTDAVPGLISPQPRLITTQTAARK